MARVRVVDPRSQRIGLIVCLIVGLIFIVIGCLIFYFQKQDEKICTDKVDGVVVELVARKSTSTRKNHHSSTTYAPVYEYDYKGHHYRVQSSISSSPASFSVGEQVEIMVDPDDPSHIYVPADKASRLICIIFAGIGGVFAAIGAIGLLLVSRKLKNDRVEPAVYSSTGSVNADDFWQ